MISNHSHWLRVAAIALFMAPLTTKAELAPHWRGDINNDGKITVADVAEMNRLLVTYSSNPALALERNEALDTNKDGKFNKTDITYLLKMLFGEIKSDNINANPSGSFSDGEQGTPGDGIFNDNTQGSPETEGDKGSFSDDDQEDPKELKKGT